MTKFIFAILIASFGSLTLSAQSREPNYNPVADHITDGLSKNYHPDAIALSKLCNRGCIFIKFKVNKQGHITHLSFTKNAVAFITVALTVAIDSLEHDAYLMNQLKDSGKTIIQPFIYDYQLGCKFPKISLSGTKEEGDQFLRSYYKTRDDMEHYGESLFNILNFTDGKLSAIDCILLTPFRVGATSE
ncbi:hypothetical protein BH09BAC6_BH09BAC6_29140 [soil metagenome]|jgi:hypothetical protein